MSNLQDAFDQAVLESKKLTDRPDNLTLLKMYALFKQGSEGDAPGERPGVTDFIARAKWDAWHELGKISQDEARQQYIDLVIELQG